MCSRLCDSVIMLGWVWVLVVVMWGVLLVWFDRLLYVVVLMIRLWFVLCEVLSRLLMIGVVVGILVVIVGVKVFWFFGVVNCVVVVVRDSRFRVVVDSINFRGFDIGFFLGLVLVWGFG